MINEKRNKKRQRKKQSSKLAVGYRFPPAIFTRGKIIDVLFEVFSMWNP